MTTQGAVLWRPPQPGTTRIDAFRRTTAPECPDTVALHEWSLLHPDRFWDAAWRELGMVGDRGHGPAMTGASDMAEAMFFGAAALNYAENLLAGGDRPGAAEHAIVERTEDGRRRALTWEQLRARVASVRAWLADQSVGPGDHVAAWLPNIPEAVIAMLATNALGAVYTSTSPDFGVAGVLDRFQQVEPKVLIAADGYRYAGKQHSRLAQLTEVVAALPSLIAVALVPQLDTEVTVAGTVPWSVILATPGSQEFERGPFRRSEFVLYSSGTTGRPKGIIHSGPGILLKQLTEHQLHCDIRPGDRVFYFTTCGWMMWNWLVTTLASGATIVLYDGSPFHPGPSAMWELAASERVTLFGTSAKFLDACAKAAVHPATNQDLRELRTVTSTGSPLSAEGFAYVYDHVKSDVHLASISGGTDLCGCFVIGDPTRPVRAGEIQGPALGVGADVWDDDGLVAGPGIRGELVCTTPFPSMPVGFVGDTDGSRYRAAYFERFPGVWAHGDFASRTEHGGFVIHGRSDATLNAGGVRIGTAEIYRQVEQLPQVAEGLAIGQEWDNDTRIVLFVRLADGGDSVAENLQQLIRRRLREQCSPRHVPARILAVTDMPRTRSGKLAELAVVDVVHGRPVRNTEALANPESLLQFTDRPELAN